MKKLLYTLLFLYLTACASTDQPAPTVPNVEPIPAEVWKEFETMCWQEGDIVFQISTSSQHQALELATGCPYTHVGILFYDDNEWRVYEAVQPVRAISLSEWVLLGQKGHMVAKRLKKSDKILTTNVLEAMKKEANRHWEKDYDLQFLWSDDKMYCSELVWKIYKRAADVEIGTPRAMRTFDLSAPAVQAKMKERYGEKLPLDEPMIAPCEMFDSPLLETVFSN